MVNLLFYFLIFIAMNDDQSIANEKVFLEYVVKSIVSDPASVVVTRTEDELGTLLTLKVAKDDMGRIIGKNGQTAQALRVLLRVMGSQQNARVNMKIIEPEEDDSASAEGDMTSVLDEPELDV